MRKVSTQASNALISNKAFKSSNTKVVIEDGCTRLYLFDNLIATNSPEGLFIRNAGWFSRTTKERLNSLPGVSIYQKDSIWYLNGKRWNGSLVNINEWK